MNIFFKTDEFNDWFLSLKDHLARAKIIQRLDKAQAGHFGDCKPVGKSVHEMRIHYGAGYRLYYSRVESVTYWLLIGGDKASQQRDIEQAIELAKEIKGKNI